MNTDTGQIIESEAFKKFAKSLPPNIKEMRIPPTAAQCRRGYVGRNDPCPCGSGKKFKRCCYTGAATPQRLMERRKAEEPEP